MYNGQILRVVSIFSSSTLQESEYVYLSKCWTIAFKRTDPIDGQNRCNCFTSILTSICLVLVSMHSSPRGAHSWHFLFLLSGLGRWRLGWHHEQQRAVSCIPVAHLLNFTKKCQKKKKKSPGTPKLPVSDLGFDPVKCPTEASDGSTRHKNG